VLLAAVALFSFFVATVPGEALDRMTRAAASAARLDAAGGDDRRAAAGFNLPFMMANSEGALFGIFRRNLVVTDADLVADKDQIPGEPSLSLRDRDLRYARLDRSDLHQADLTGSNLDGASLVGTDLRGAWLQCADLNELLLSGDRRLARCSSARGANFTRARLGEAHMAGLDARAGAFDEARMEAVNLSYARLTGANLSSADLEKADLTGGVEAQGANFLIAKLQGADLNGAQLQFADFSSASMQGAVLSYAQMQGAVLRDVDLEGAAMPHARLEGADMTGAKAAGADLSGAGVWMTQPPEADASGLTDLGGLSLKPIDEADAARLNGMLERIENRKVRADVSEALAPILNLAESHGWSSAAEHARWQSMATAATAAGSDSYKGRLTEYLSRLMCKARWSNGSVATGIARRAQTPQFRGDLVVIYDRLVADDCPAAKTVLGRVQRSLSAAADIARSN
jgi:uncharacterized protein YjbI with pentapeptide repeats